MPEPDAPLRIRWYFGGIGWFCPRCGRPRLDIRIDHRGCYGPLGWDG